jgi:hypothetical protein
VRSVRAAIAHNPTATEARHLRAQLGEFGRIEQARVRPWSTDRHLIRPP